MERDQAEAEPAEPACERTSECCPDNTGLRGGNRDVDCVRESLESAAGAAGESAKGNGDAGRVRRGASPFAAADAYGERRARLLRRGAGPGSRGGRHAGDRSSGRIRHSSARQRATGRRRPCFHAAGGGSYRRALWFVAGPASPVVRGPIRIDKPCAERRKPRDERPDAYLGPPRVGGFRDRRLPAPYWWARDC